MNQPTNKEIEKVATEVIVCDACAWMKRYPEAKLLAKLDLVERKAVSNAKRNGFKILPGTPYIEEHGIFKGKPYVSKYIKEIHQINLKYGLYSYVGKTAKLN